MNVDAYVQCVSSDYSLNTLYGASSFHGDVDTRQPTCIPGCRKQRDVDRHSFPIVVEYLFHFERCQILHEVWNTFRKRLSDIAF